MRYQAYVLMLAFLLMMMLSGCSSSPDKTVISYCKAIEAGKFDEAASYLAKGARQVLDRSGGKSLFIASKGVYNLHKGIERIEITRNKADERNAVVAFTYHFKDGVKYEDYFPLTKEGGTWKITK